MRGWSSCWGADATDTSVQFFSGDRRVGWVALYWGSGGILDGGGETTATLLSAAMNRWYYIKVTFHPNNDSLDFYAEDTVTGENATATLKARNSYSYVDTIDLFNAADSCDGYSWFDNIKGIIPHKKGVLYSKVIENPGGFFSADYESPPGTSLSFEVLTPEILSLQSVWSGSALIDPSQAPEIVLRANFSSDGLVTPILRSWSAGTQIVDFFNQENLIEKKENVSIAEGAARLGVKLPGEEPADEHTLGLWHFNEGTGTTVYDESANNNDATISGAIWTADCMFGSCLSFDGINDRVDFGYNPSWNVWNASSTFTIEGWFYIETDAGYSGIFSGSEGDNIPRIWFHTVAGGRLFLSMADSHGKSIEEHITVEDMRGAWHHWALVYDAGDLKVFVDGIERFSRDAPFTGSFILGSGYWSFGIKWAVYSWREPLKGRIDEVRISNVAKGYYLTHGTLESVNFTTTAPIVNITPSWSATIPTNLSVYVSADGGGTWCEAENGTTLIDSACFGTGNNLKYKVDFTSDGTATPLLHDITLAYEIDIIPPESIFNLQNFTGITWINWTWENPADADFSHTMIYINSSFVGNVSSSYYNLTNLVPNTSHTISTRTVDSAGNINETWVNQTTFTLAEIPELSASVVSSSQIDLSWESDNPEGTFYELFEDSELIYSGTSTFYNHTNLSPSTTYYYKLRAKNGADVYTENVSIEATTKSAIICGDGRCEGSETCSSCPQDCGRCPSGRRAYCGDGRCDSGEDCSSCPDDCGVCPTPTPTPTPTPAPALPANVSILIKKDVGSLQAGESKVVSFEESDIWEIEINVKNAVSDVSIEIQQIIGKPNVSDAPGISYRYLNITAENLTQEDLKNATIRFRVNLSWIEENEIDEEKIALQRYNETENWVELPTEMIGEENESLLYESISQGFSIFAITGEMKIAPPSPLPVVTPAPSPVVTPEVLPSPLPTPAIQTPAPPFPGFEAIVAFFALAIVYIQRYFQRE